MRGRSRRSVSLKGLLLSVLAGGLLLGVPSLSHCSDKVIDVIDVEGIINPVTSEFIIDNIRRASDEGVLLLIIRLDTPGGLDTSMRTIIKEMLNSPIPIVVYVAPSGARAASAGVLITMAAHLAAMAPGTNIGAAHPVAMGGQKMDEEMAKKVENDAVAYIKSIASKRGRNVKWAEDAVRKSVSITAEEAVEMHVVDMIAGSLQELLQKIDGRKVETEAGTVVISTKDAKVVKLRMGLRHRILRALSDPNIVYILMMLGLAGIYFELSHPGSIFPGVIGAICLILAFYSFQALPVNYAGILLIILGIILFILEMKITSFGMLTVGGIISLVLGSLMLFKGAIPGMKLSWQTLIPTIAIASGFFITVATLAFKAQRRKPEVGMKGMIGEVGYALSRLAPEGKVFVHGETWNGVSEEVIEEGEKLRVIDVSGLTLKVERLKQAGVAPERNPTGAHS